MKRNAAKRKADAQTHAVVAERTKGTTRTQKNNGEPTKSGVTNRNRKKGQQNARRTIGLFRRCFPRAARVLLRFGVPTRGAY